MSSTRVTAEQPWTRPWWKPSEGNGLVFLYIVSIHILTIVGLVLFPIPSWRVALTALALASIGGVGTSVCYHRALAHKALQLNPIVEHILIFFTILNASGEPITWVANHRNHHSKADTEDDVSSPRHGGFGWAHVRWVYQWSGSDPRRWAPDLCKPKYQIWQKLQTPIVLLSLFGGGLLFGWQGLFWVGAIRLVYVMHGQMFVNSLLHMTPGLPEGVDSSRNIWWLGPLQLGAWGENWHRNHHFDAASARFGRRWWQVDVGWGVIRFLKSLHLAKNVRLPKEIRQRQSAAIARQAESG